MMLISQIDGSSELAPSDLKGSTTGRQSSSVMLKHMVYFITVTIVLVSCKLVNLLAAVKEIS